ncbi:MAG: radical SAM protein [Patescibacteria group bacterium]
MIKILNKIKRKGLSEVSYVSGDYRVPPTFITVNITFSCNFNCRSCSAWKSPTPDNVSEADWLKFICDLFKIFPRDAFVELSGGEPLLKKDLLLKIIPEFKKYFTSVSLNTNGSLISQELVAELEKAGVNIIKLSLYSLDKDVHNFLRQTDIAYDKAINALNIITKSKIELEIGAMVAKQNIDSLPELITNLSRHQKVVFNLQALDESYKSEESHNREGNFLLSELWPTKEQTKKFFSWLYQNRNPKIKNILVNLKLMEKYYLDPPSVMSLRCFTGQKNLIINPDGGVYLCLKGRPIGNITEGNIGQILKSPSAKQERLAIKTCKKYCRIKGFNHFRGLKELFIR